MRSALDELCARGPWSTQDGDFTAEQVRALLAAVPAGKAAMCAAMGVDFFTDRRADRALQLLRKAGLIRYVGGAWEVSSA